MRNTICSYVHHETGEICYGCIEFFVAMPEPTALVFVFHDNDISLMRQSGHPCRPQLCTYKEIDLLSTFFKSVTTIPATTSH